MLVQYPISLNELAKIVFCGAIGLFLVSAVAALRSRTDDPALYLTSPSFTPHRRLRG